MIRNGELVASSLISVFLFLFLLFPLACRACFESVVLFVFAVLSSISESLTLFSVCSSSASFSSELETDSRSAVVDSRSINSDDKSLRFRLALDNLSTVSVSLKNFKSSAISSSL